MQQEKAEKIRITLPQDMLASIKKEVRSGSYGSTSELIRDAMKLWQKREEEHEARISSIRERLTHSEHSGETVPLNTAFKTIEELHQQNTKTKF
ncbi:MAG: type II toxin-antitoxin system ParD family antitoxin [Desulforegulaceae bacterium]|nr:type II toxin-antitoxin system ParD family antitoxin [Desulforegulaceae bacterium]